MKDFWKTISLIFGICMILWGISGLQYSYRIKHDPILARVIHNQAVLDSNMHVLSDENTYLARTLLESIEAQKILTTKYLIFDNRIDTKIKHLRPINTTVYKVVCCEDIDQPLINK